MHAQDKRRTEAPCATYPNARRRRSAAAEEGGVTVEKVACAWVCSWVLAVTGGGVVACMGCGLFVADKSQGAQCVAGERFDAAGVPTWKSGK